MIETLHALPALTESWLAGLKSADPDLYEELATSLVISLARETVEADLPAGVSRALSQVELRGKEIGAFRFAPIAGSTAVEQIAAYDQLIRQDYDVDGDVVFIGEYGSGIIFVSPQGVGLLDTVPQPPRIRAFAGDVSAFLIVQANAYDAYKRYLVKQSDVAGYLASAAQCAALPAFTNTDVLAIFDAQRFA